MADDREAGAFSLADLEALQAAGVIEIHDSESPDADAFDVAMVIDLDVTDGGHAGGEGLDALTSARLLQQTALAAESHAALVGSVLAAHRGRERWTREQLADWLGLSFDGLALLALEPRDADVDVLAERYGLNRGRLAQALA
jgi:hypothetical protein